MVVTASCVTASAETKELPTSNGYYGYRYDESSENIYANRTVFEAETFPFYYPPSEAEIRHDGHGNFTVSGLTGGVITSDAPFTTVITPETESSNSIGSMYPASPSSWQGTMVHGSGAHTAAAVREGNLLGTLTIRERSIRVYEGTSNNNLLQGAGHFTGTSAWDGNACFAGHNRGPNAWFYDLISLRTGDTINYSTSLGTRTYRVSSIRTVSVNDLSPLNFTDTNQLTLVTCLANQPSVRLIVTAVQI